jgi:hypothetical protein
VNPGAVMRVVRPIVLIAVVWLAVDAACPRYRCRGAFGTSFTTETVSGTYGLEADYWPFGYRRSLLSFIRHPPSLRNIYLCAGPAGTLPLDRVVYLFLGFVVVVGFEIIYRPRRVA